MFDFGHIFGLNVDFTYYFLGVFFRDSTSFLEILLDRIDEKIVFICYFSGSLQLHFQIGRIVQVR
jgi:hypothetical protein